jgi:hypothetical protein
MNLKTDPSSSESHFALLTGVAAQDCIYSSYFETNSQKMDVVPNII